MVLCAGCSSNVLGEFGVEIGPGIVRNNELLYGDKWDLRPFTG